MTTEDNDDRTSHPVNQALAIWLEQRESGHPIQLDEVTHGLSPAERVEFDQQRIVLQEMLDEIKDAEVNGPLDDQPLPAPSGSSHRYVDLKYLDSGGMGDVFLAHDVELGRVVVYKVINSNREEGRRRFRREAEITAKLQSPGIVPVYGLVEDDQKRLAYAMEFVDGPTFGDLIRAFHAEFPAPGRGERERAPRKKARWELVRRVLDACRIVAHAHAYRPAYVHCDLKPRNIKIAHNDPEGSTEGTGQFQPIRLLTDEAATRRGTTRVLDWGLARTIAEGRPDGEGWSGTEGYIQPSLKGGGPLTRSADVYSLGATLAAALFGLTKDGRPDLDRAESSATPRVLRSIVKAAMADGESVAYGTASEMADDIENYLSGKRVSVDPGPIHEQSWRWISRHRTLVSTTIVAAFAIAATVTGFTTAKLNAERASRESNLNIAILGYVSAAETADKLIRSSIDPVKELAAARLLIDIHRRGDGAGFDMAAKTLIASLEASNKDRETLIKEATQTASNAIRSAIDTLLILDREFPGKRQTRLRLANAYSALAILGLRVKLVEFLSLDLYKSFGKQEFSQAREVEVAEELAMLDKSDAVLPGPAEDSRTIRRDNAMSRMLILLQAGRFTEACMGCDATIALSEPIESIMVRLIQPIIRKAAESEQADLPWSRGPNADHPRAIRLAEYLASRPGVSPQAIYKSACAFALASSEVEASAVERERRASRAIGYLQGIAAQGYFRVDKYPDELRKHPDFDSLRSRADFQRLLAALPAPAPIKPASR